MKGSLYDKYDIDPSSCPDPTKSLVHYDENIRKNREVDDIYFESRHRN